MTSPLGHKTLHSFLGAHRLTTKLLDNATYRDARRAEFWFDRYNQAYRDSPNLEQTVQRIRQQLQKCNEV